MSVKTLEALAEEWLSLDQVSRIGSVCSDLPENLRLFALERGNSQRNYPTSKSQQYGRTRQETLYSY